MGQNFNCNRKGVKTPSEKGSYRESAGLPEIRYRERY